MIIDIVGDDEEEDDEGDGGDDDDDHHHHHLHHRWPYHCLGLRRHNFSAEPPNQAH